MLAKTQTPAMIGRWGFRRSLLGNGWECAAGLATCAAYALPGWNLTAIAATIAVTGVFRAIQFHALSAIAYADLPPEKVASATTLNTMAWQLAVMLGIALSTLVVEASAAWQGRGVPAANDYAAAFLMLAVVCLAAMPCYRALPEDAGSELSGHSARTT